MIGIFDSGLGGLTVVKAIMDALPGYDITYFGDTARTPYGTKSKNTVIRYSLENTNFLLNNGAKLIIMACNTASSVATENLSREYSIPIFEVITPAVEMAITHASKQRIGVIGTRATINSGVYETKIKQVSPSAKVYSQACPLLVPLVEEGWLKKPETAMIAKKYLHKLKMKQVDTLILGCTHYPLLKKTIQRKIGSRVNIIDSSIAVAGKVTQFLTSHKNINDTLSRNNQIRFFVSDVTEQFKITAKVILNRNAPLEHVER